MDKKPKKQTPPYRKLRGYAFDPSLSQRIDTAFINDIVYRVPWEDDLALGPCGEYLEVIDYDPSVDQFYEPVNLQDPFVLAQDGLNPSESNPKFHQQMVYAVAMTTIKNFERSLGRKILWSFRQITPPSTQRRGDGYLASSESAVDKYGYVKALRVYPHAFRGANAYYSPLKKALLFGYFSAQPADVTLQMPNALVFTCLSHDIIAHETTHAILDGIHSQFTENSNKDTLAFHEAFADIVALFQHFTFPEVLKHQVAKTKGNLSGENLLGQLAQEFGSSIGRYGALRDALGEVDPLTREWKPRVPDGNEYQKIVEPHERGSILVSAVFEAFINIYNRRTADLLRIATSGTGILPEGQLHPDLVNRLAEQATKSAKHILQMCIRALDYCPPLDINFGDFLRAVITADRDLIPEDNRDYRLAFIAAFRRRGIYPLGIKSLSEESLSHPMVNFYHLGKEQEMFQRLRDFFREFKNEISYLENREEIFGKTKNYIVGNQDIEAGPLFDGIRKTLYEKIENSLEFEKLTGLVFSKNCEAVGVRRSNSYSGDGPSFFVHTMNLSSRVGPDGEKSNQIILTLTQRAGIKVGSTGKIEPFVLNKENPYKNLEGGFIMRGGVTLIFDLDDFRLKYIISKPLLDVKKLEKKVYQIDEKRALQLYNYYHEDGNGADVYKAYFERSNLFPSFEPFAFLHNH
ncbi:MAG TPA: hypothetical protein PLC89_08305 [Haliscomenobacter sp.]|uniref:hypothetical protein n=1 Tax=Haliscomenobacter sp. TaxID=2717303 RepID=UPI002C85D5B1|nr:hypothetical protein [Haliscomenobacter sp.]HOY17280.1 hypothetical protein [Haliscomenobacter sp.]HPH17574.1 hypothetical protein [Haliscomenobacter sp.]